MDALTGKRIVLPEVIKKITRIDESMLDDAPEFSEVAKELSDFLKPVNTLIAHNLMFDKGMLEIDYKRWNLQHLMPEFDKLYCTVEKSYCLMNKRLPLYKIYEMLKGEEMGEAHRAKADVENLFEVFKELYQQGFIL